MHAWNKFTRAWSLSQPGHWPKPVTRFELLGPAESHGPSWAQQKKIKNYFKKSVIFPCIFLLNFAYYWFIFLYLKDTNSVLKYLVFVKTLIYIYIFMHTVKSLKNKKSYCIFIQQRKIQKYVLACILALIITSLLKSQELGQYFKNFKKNYLIFY